MAESKGDRVFNLLHEPSNPVRDDIMEALGERGHATFSDLLVICDLDLYYQKGLLDYHIKELCKSGILTKSEAGYVLTSLGKIVARFLRSVRREYQIHFTARELRKGGEIVELNMETFEEKDAREVSMAKYGTEENEKDERLWAYGNRVPLKYMSEWGKTVSLLARKNGKIIGVLYGNTIPMHVVSKHGKELGVVQPTTDKPANRLHGEIFEIWVHPDCEGQQVEKLLIKEFIDQMKDQGAVAVIAERILTENEEILKAFEELGFERIASHQDFKVEI